MFHELYDLGNSSLGDLVLGGGGGDGVLRPHVRCDDHMLEDVDGNCDSLWRVCLSCK